MRQLYQKLHQKRLVQRKSLESRFRFVDITITWVSVYELVQYTSLSIVSWSQRPGRTKTERLEVDFKFVGFSVYGAWWILVEKPSRETNSYSRI
jgi:hypothetical protein